MYKGRVLGDDCKVKRPIQEIVGSSNEADVKVDGKKAKALVDTGSGINTISEKFYRENLQHRELQSLYDMLQIECANGESLPYLGFVEVDFESDGIPIKMLRLAFSHCARYNIQSKDTNPGSNKHTETSNRQL